MTDHNPPASYRVLCVDASAARIDFVSHILSPRGFTVVTAANADDAIAQLATTSPDLVLITDYSIAGVIEEAFSAGVPVIMMAKPFSIRYLDDRLVYLRDFALDNIVETVCHSLRISLDTLALMTECRGQLRMRTVVFVDAGPTEIDEISKVLAHRAFKVVHTTDGARGLELITALRPDLVLLNVDQPAPGGLTIWHTMQADETLCKLTVIALTSKLYRPFDPNLPLILIKPAEGKLVLALRDILGSSDFDI